MSANPAETAVLIAGHGSSRAPETAESVLMHTARLRARGVFADVRAGFLKQAPFLAGALAGITAPRVVIAPFMASDGYVTSHLMPEALGAHGENPRVLRAAAAGSHPIAAHAAADNIRALLQSGAARSADPHVLVIGHGTRRNPANERAARRFTAALADALPPGTAAETVFLEHNPRLADWAARPAQPAQTARTARAAERPAAQTVTFAVPFLMAGGGHLKVDVPRDLGVPGAAAPVDAPFAGPFSARGQARRRRIFLMRAVGFEPALTDAVEARVMEALARARAAA